LFKFPITTRLKPCKYGMMLYPIHDVYIGRSLDIYGEFSEGEVELFRQIVQPGHVVLEIGANIGTHTVWFAQAVGENGHVLAFEPQRIVYQILCANLALNHIPNVRAFQAAVGREPGQITVPTFNFSQTNNYGGLALGQHTQGEPVPVHTVDGLGLKRCHFIKIDVEGMEQTVLEGATETIRRLSPLLYVENDRQEKSAALIHYIHNLGYHMYWHTPPLFNPKNFAGNPENVFGNIASMNMICIPKEVTQQIHGLQQIQV
jgi:FkbM family methyltransferase